MPWLLAKTFGLPRYLWALAIAAVLVGLYLWLGAAERADDKSNQEIGAVKEREATTTTVLQRTEQGNDAREEIKRPDDAGAQLRYDQCLRSARTPANCQRFLPQR